MQINNILFTITVLVTTISAQKLFKQRERPICVPRNTCILEGGVDVRTIVPDENDRCPNGRVKCNQLVDATNCGYNYDRFMFTDDGPAPYGAHPWLAYITNQTGYTGSGVLLDRYHVLTAAHKVYRNKHSLQKLEVYIGVHDANALGDAYKRHIEDIIIHPDFDAETLRHDLAVLRLKAHVPIGYQKNVGTACLPRKNERFTHKRCTVAGWGVTRFGTPTASHVQKQVQVPIVPYETCRNSMRQLLGANTDLFLRKDGEICAGGEAGRDACTDDGGSPLICRDENGRKVIAGLVIWGKECGRPNVYGVYVDVPKYVDWIHRAVRNLQA